MTARCFGWLLIVVVLAAVACDDPKKKPVDNDPSDSDDLLIGDSDDLTPEGTTDTVTGPDADFSATCGNGMIDGDEPCDGDAKNCTEIDPNIYSGGKAKCKKDCSGYDTATCDEVPHECGTMSAKGPRSATATPRTASR